MEDFAVARRRNRAAPSKSYVGNAHFVAAHDPVNRAIEPQLR